MTLKLLLGSMVAAGMLAVAPAWADGGHGQGRGHWKHWHKHGHHQSHYVVRHGYPVYHSRVVVREYAAPVAVYPAYPAPAPGVSLFVTLR